ncbi:MAG: hypothetical protein ACQESR_07655 [Planctomycetota bacterium]
MKYDDVKKLVTLGLLNKITDRYNDLVDKAEQQYQEWLRNPPRDKWNPAQYAAELGAPFTENDRKNVANQLRKMMDEGYVTDPAYNERRRRGIATGHERPKLSYIQLTPKGVQLALDLIENGDGSDDA